MAIGKRHRSREKAQEKQSPGSFLSPALTQTTVEIKRQAHECAPAFGRLEILSDIQVFPNDLCVNLWIGFTDRVYRSAFSRTVSVIAVLSICDPSCVSELFCKAWIENGTATAINTANVIADT